MKEWVRIWEMDGTGYSRFYFEKEGWGEVG